MQENTLKKTLKRVAAVGTSAAMVGMTLTGALAADLSNYPAPFDGANTVFVVGASASNEDSAAAADIAGGLPKSAGSVFGGVTTGTNAMPATTALTDYEKLEDPAIGEAFNATDHFGQTVDADDLEGLQDTTVDIDIDNVDDDYDVRDEIRFGGNTNIDQNALLSAHTALTYDGDEDWKDRVFVPMEPNSWGYYYVFEDALKQGNFLANASASDSIEIEFLGKLFELEGISTDTATDEVIVNVGQKFYMDAGDCVTVDGKEVCLISTSTATNSPATVSVDGVREVVNVNSEEIINGLEVRVEDVSADEGIEYDSATLYVGEDARETFSNTEEFVGEDEDDPAWKWHIANVHTAAPTLGIRWSLSLDNPEETDNPLYEHPLYEGEAICLPFDYACIVFDSLQIDDYQDYQMQAGVAKDLYYNVTHADANVVDQSSEKVIEFSAKGSSDDGFITGTDIGDTTQVETDTVYLAVNCNSGALQVYRAEQDGNDAILFSEVRAESTIGNNPHWNQKSADTTIEFGSYIPGGSQDVFQIDYRDTLMNVDFDWFVPANATAANQQDEMFSDSEWEAGAQTHGGACNTSLAWNTFRLNGTANLTTVYAPAYGAMMINPVTTRGENISIYFETDENAIQTTNGEFNDFEYLGDSKGDTLTAYDVVYGDWNHTRKIRYLDEQNLSDAPQSATTFFEKQVSSSDLFALVQIGNIVNGMPATQTAIDISGWEEDTRTSEGIIILDPEAHQSSDKFEIRVPSDASDFKVNIILRTSGASGSGARLREDVGVVTEGPAVMKDSDVSDLTKYNAIVVGGPCVNKYAAELLGLTFPSCGVEGNLPFGAGEAVIELKKNGVNYALLVAGYEAEDTRRAGVVLENYAQFKLSGESKIVKGEGLEVAGITLE